ncbi:MAG: NADAR family protein [Oligoflexia bacterium]|nr:NADAR family protein [Oligoflexia bacterium]
MLFSFLTAFNSQYPKHWWEPVSKKGAPEWEILPQEAKYSKKEVILSKRHELGLLSNFAATAFNFKGKKYASLEGFWQAMLYPENKEDKRATYPGLVWKYTRSAVEQMVGFEAKAAGELARENMKKMKINWVSFDGKQFDYITKEKGEHYKLIFEALKEKVNQNEEVKKVLLATKGLKLLPDHHQEPEASPAWKYNLMLMEIRDSIK